MNQKSASLILETILSLALFSVVALVTVNTVSSLSRKNHTLNKDLQSILELESTKYFIQKNSTTQITLKDDTLYFQNSILLKNISSYNIVKNANNSTINICLKKNTICQEWIINE